MNKKQKLVLIIGIIILVSMASFPPWYGKVDVNSSEYHDLGYHYIYGDEKYYLFSGDFAYIVLNPRVDLPRFILPFTSVALITGGLLVILKSKPQD